MDMETVIGAFEYFGGIAPTIVGQFSILLSAATLLLYKRWSLCELKSPSYLLTLYCLGFAQTSVSQSEVSL